MTTSMVRGRVDTGVLDRSLTKNFRRDVQALRGVAVLIVVLYHSKIILPGGFVGVDVFLVISGFVIGRLLVAGFASTDGVELRSFYLRRIRRLLPALSAMLVTVIVLSPVLAPVGAKQTGPRTGLAAALLSANAYLFKVTGRGYFNVDAALNPLLHTWSLSVEEQFYLAFPLLLFAVWKIGRRLDSPVASLKLFTGVLFSSSLALCIWLSFGGATRLRFAFFSPVTRGWEFAAGLALVLLPPMSSPRFRHIARATGLLIIAYSAVVFSDATIFPGVAALLPVLGAALVIHGGSLPDGETPELESNRFLQPIVTLGDISYSWYLWHWPLIVFAGAFWPMSGRLPLVVAALVSLIPAWYSYRLLENRMRTSKHPSPRRTLALGALCVTASILAFGFARISGTFMVRQSGASVLDQALEFHLDKVENCDSKVPLGERPVDSCTWKSGKPGPRVVLIGDSNAGQFGEGLVSAIRSTGGEVTIATKSACPVLDLLVTNDDQGRMRSCRRFVTGTEQELQKNPPDVIILANATDVYLGDERFRLASPESEDPIDSANRKGAIEDALKRTLATLSESGARVVLVQTVPKPGDGYRVEGCSPLAAAVSISRCLSPAFSTSDIKTLGASNSIEQSAAAATDTETWNFSEQICPGGLCEVEKNGLPVWRDGKHLSVSASRGLAPDLAGLLAGNS